MAVHDGRSLALDLRALLEEAGPEGVARTEFERLGIAGTPPARILCLGKAAPALARATAGLWPGIPGLLYATGPEAPCPEGFMALWGDHPVPTGRNLDNTARVRRWLEEGEGPLLACVSGGASSLLVEPRPPWTLEAKAALTASLLVRGADIRDLNAVRARLSGVKCGGLGSSVGRWAVTTAVWSDVGPRHARLVGSGPTIPWVSSCGAEEVLRRLAVRPPMPLPQARAPRPPREGDRWFVLYDALRLRRACIEHLRGLGFTARAVPCPEGSAAKEVAAHLRAEFGGCRTRRPLALVGVGEPAVDPRGRRGRGGRCSHLAAELALAMRGEASDGWAFAALATDGVDGSAGSGAWVDGDTVPGLELVRSAMRTFDTGALWEANGSLLPRAPTGNNLRDLWVLVQTGGRG